MSDQPQSWQSYEQVAVEIMNKIAAMLGLESVEGKQSVYGSRTGTDWEIDGKGVKVGGESFVIIECRRYSKQKQDGSARWLTASVTLVPAELSWSARSASKREPRR